jgi:transmembrane sensor
MKHHRSTNRTNSRTEKEMRLARVRKQAAKWYVRLDTTEDVPEKQLEFERWRAESPEHRDEFSDLERDCERIRLVGDIDLQDFGASAVKNGKPTTRSLPIRIWVSLPKWTLVAVAVLGGCGLFAVNMTPKKVVRVVWQGFKTGVGERRQVSFFDGSTAELNTDTSLYVSVTSGHREARLDQGEALFDVVRNDEHPFVVRAGDSHVEAVATRFVITRRPARPLTTLVMDGEVKVCMVAQEPRLVDANHAASVTPKGVEVTALKAGEADRRMAWLKGELRFDGQSLAEVVDEFNRYNEERLSIVDPGIRDIPVGGVYIASDPLTFALLIEQSLGVRHGETYSSDGKRIIELTGRGKR